MTWLLEEEDNALQNSNFDPFLKKKKKKNKPNFNNHRPMKWSSSQCCGLCMCLNLIRHIPRKGSSAFVPECWSLCVCLSNLYYSAWHYISARQHSTACCDNDLTFPTPFKRNAWFTRAHYNYICQLLSFNLKREIVQMSKRKDMNRCYRSQRMEKMPRIK